MARGNHSATPSFFTPLRLCIAGIVVLAALGIGLALTASGSPSAKGGGASTTIATGSGHRGTTTTVRRGGSSATSSGNGSGSGGFARSGLPVVTGSGAGTTGTTTTTGRTGNAGTTGASSFSTQSTGTAATTVPSSHTCDLTLKQYSAQTFAATYTSNGPAQVVVTLKLSAGTFKSIAGGDQNGGVLNDATSTTGDGGTASFLFTTNSAPPGTTKAFLYASSAWCTPFPVAIPLS